MDKPSALALISGGLDSILAALTVKNQAVEITGIAFKSLFFKAKSAQAAAQEIDIPLLVKDISKKHLEIVKQPKYGYGKRLNPCLDCHLLMLKEAKKVIDKQGFDFLVTGEVLGQRPFSQTKKALKKLEKAAGLAGLVLRPLSAQCLVKTIPEKKGWVNSSQLLAITGRSRQKQLKLAEKYRLENFASPGTSCLLTDPHFCQRLKKLLTNQPDAQAKDIDLLKVGRHFWQKKRLIVVGRNHSENQKIKKLAQKGDFLLELKEIPGPTVLIREKSVDQNQAFNQAKQLLIRYSPKAQNQDRADLEFLFSQV